MCQELAKGACLVWSCRFDGGVIISRCSQVFYAKASNSKTYWEGSFSVKLWSGCLDQLIQHVSCYTQLTGCCHVETQGSPWTWGLQTPRIWRSLFPFDFAFLKTRNKEGDEVVVIFCCGLNTNADSLDFKVQLRFQMLWCIVTRCHRTPAVAVSQRCCDSALATPPSAFDVQLFPALRSQVRVHPDVRYLQAHIGGVVIILPWTAALARLDYEKLYRLILRQGAVANINILLY